MHLRFVLLLLLCNLIPILQLQAEEPSAEGLRFFESKIRPVLVQHCYECHANDSKKILGGLLVDSRAGLHTGGDSGAAIVPGKPDESLLLEAIKYESFEMPPKQKLSEEVIADFEKWIQMGAPDPREGSIEKIQSGIDLEQGKQFWSFQPLKKPAVPEAPSSTWPETNIDQFIWKRQQEAGVKPVEDASRITLVRRITFALTGLPPTVEEVEEFVNDPASLEVALGGLIDRLLDSPHFGERWGRHWLDVVRFAESSGGGRSLMFKDAWRFRDYVIAAFNKDKPVNQLIREHIAGDLLPYEGWQQRSEQLVATGFLALGPTNYELQDKELLRLDVIDEQIDTMGRAFLGMTLNCARCHDHKFDPIPTKDYYALAGIFGNTESLVLANVSNFVERRLPIDEAFHPQLNQLEQELSEVKQQLAQKKKTLAALKGNSPNEKQQRDGLNKSIQALTASQEELRKKLKPLKPIAMSVNEAKEPKNGYLHIRGAARNLGPEVPRGFLSVIDISDSYAKQIPTDQSGRLQLADWIVAPNNPLTARVYVNRVWRQLFGVGLVRTTDNFGTTGETPSHPTLLDYLAHRLIESNWSTKELIREIMLSRVYRLASRYDASNSEKDVENRLLWRTNRRRLEAEALRDSLLFVSGQLDFNSGGNSITKFSTYDYGYEFKSKRRSVYVPVFRSSMYDFFEVFDMANPNIVVGNRNTSTLATQSLFLMNSPLMIEQSQHTARRLLAVPDLAPPERINLLHQWALGRPATTEETELALKYLQNFTGANPTIDDNLEKWSTLCHSVLSCLDFLYVD